ncbi:MAG TPA: septum formation family protein [Acidimicrobiales bacterium]|nr:septum formation family protein [Acidimicrobiales bacterium]
MTARARRLVGVLVTAAALAAGCAEYAAEPSASSAADGAANGAAVAAAPVTTTTTVAAERVLAGRTEVGDCLVGAEDSFTGARFVDRVACSTPHDLQVIALVELGGPDDAWPGRTLVAEAADRACLAAFEAAVGEPWAESSLDYVVLAPSPVDWSDGRRAARCAALMLSGAPLTAPLT